MEPEGGKVNLFVAVKFTTTGSTWGYFFVFLP